MKRETLDATIQHAQRSNCMGNKELCQVLPLLLMRLIEAEAWVPQRFPDFYSFAVGPLRRGLAMDGKKDRMTYEEAINYCNVKHPNVGSSMRAEMPDLPRDGEIGRSRGGNRFDNIKPIASVGGTSACYLTRRLWPI